jgi:predicted flavoprotein YhiN
MLTENGIEGGLIYAASSKIRDHISKNGTATIYLDLFPEKTISELTAKLNKPRGKLSVAKFWRNQLKLDGVKAGLLREILTVEALNSPELVAKTLKTLPLNLLSPRPIDEAISSAGGISFDELDENLMCKKLTGVFCAGEMLDWEAPTGGYLLTACFATGRAAGLGALKWLEQKTNYPCSANWR